MTQLEAGTAVVIDTNCVLDLWVFRDQGASGLLRDLVSGRCRWHASAAMRDELRRVLAYPLITARLEATRQTAEQILALFDTHALIEEAAPAPCPVRCRDADDQMFIDLAAQRRAVLVSKDGHVLELARRLAAYGVQVRRPWSEEATSAQAAP